MNRAPLSRLLLVAVWRAFALATMLAVMGTAHAHAVVVYSSLQDHPVQPEAPATVTLRFNAAIEQPLTELFLIDPSGQKHSLAFTAGAQRGEIAVKLPPLPAGTYQLQYKVMASDGHLTENALQFRVPEAR